VSHGTITVIFVVSFNKRFAANARGLQEEFDGYYIDNAMVSARSTASPSMVVLIRGGASKNLALEIWDMQL